LNKSGAAGLEADAKTAIIAGANPQHGVWDTTMKLLENLNLRQELLARFDWIIGFIDSSSIQTAKIDAHVLYSTIREAEKPFMNEQKLRHFINSVRKLKPEMTEPAIERILEFRSKITQKFEDNTQIPMETRQLHAIVRACTGYAKLNLKEKIDVADVEEVIRLLYSSYRSINLKVEEGTIQTLLEDPGANKDKCVFNAWHLAEDPQGLVDKSQLFDILQAQFGRFFKNVFDCQNMFQQHEGKRFLLQPNGKYRLSL